MIGLFGSRQRRIHAAYQLFFFTLLGSFTMLIAIGYIYIQTGSTSLFYLDHCLFQVKIERILFFLFFIPLAVKIPLVPFHIWLPEAHVEAPTIGSVVLAALILKLAGFGILRILIPLCSTNGSVFHFQPYVFTICILGTLFAAFTALRQVDIKKIIAYSSVVHMSYATLGLFSNNVLAIMSSIHAMFCHGVISAGLFFVVGSLYVRYTSRELIDFRGLIVSSPRLGFVTFFFLLSNLAFPVTGNFPAELGIFLALVHENLLISLLLIIPLILNGVYNIWLATRLCFGNAPKSTIQNKVNDLSNDEMLIFYSFILLIIWLCFGASYFFSFYTDIAFTLLEHEVLLHFISGSFTL